MVSVEEFEILQGYKHQRPHKLMQAKAEAILLLSRQMGVEVVADMAQQKISTIATWARDWHASRLASIHTGHAGNPIEHVWNDAKNHTSNIQRATFNDTRYTFETYIRNNTFPCNIKNKLLINRPSPRLATLNYR